MRNDLLGNELLGRQSYQRGNLTSLISECGNAKHETRPPPKRTDRNEADGPFFSEFDGIEG